MIPIGSKFSNSPTPQNAQYKKLLLQRRNEGVGNPVMFSPQENEAFSLDANNELQSRNSSIDSFNQGLDTDTRQISQSDANGLFERFDSLSPDAQNSLRYLIRMGKLVAPEGFNIQ